MRTAAKPAPAGLVAPESRAQTRPDYFRGLTTGLGVVPRRGWDAATAAWLTAAQTNPITGLRRWATTAPGRLLAVLGETHPYFKRARANDLSLAFGPIDVKIVAVRVEKGADADGNPTSREVVDSEGTAALDAFWDGLPSAIGGLRGLSSAIYDHLTYAGMTVVEVVPGVQGGGLSLAQTADPNTFQYVDTAAGRLLQQNQGGQWVTMDPETVRGIPWDGSRDNPYGVPRWSAALQEGLRDWKHQGNLDDILYEVAWPRVKWGFPLQETVKFAQEHPNVLKGQGTPLEDGRPTDATPEEWAFNQFAAFGKAMAEKRHDDSLGYLQDGSIDTMNGGEGLASLEGTLKGLLVRLITALLQPLTLMNLHVGGTLAYSDTEWSVHAKQLEDLRAFVLAILCWIATQHLRYLGLALAARADVKPIQIGDEKDTQSARKTQIANALTLFDNGLISEEDLAMTLTGSGVVDKDKLAKRASGAGSLGTDDVPPKSPEPADPTEKEPGQP